MYSGKKNHKYRIRMIFISVLIGMALICAAYSAVSGKDEPTGEVKAEIVNWIQRQTMETYMPVLGFMQEETSAISPLAAIKQLLAGQLPIYGYSEMTDTSYVSMEDEDTYDLLIRQEGTDEERREPEDGSLEYGEDALHIDGDLERAMLEENKIHSKGQKENQEIESAADSELQETDKASEEIKGDFVKAEHKSYEYKWGEIQEYEDIVSAFYAIDKTTSITNEQLNLDNLLDKDMTIQTKPENVQILIYHTHSQEAFADSVPGDASTTIVGAGERLAEILREEYGFNVIHHKGEYDVEARDYAYSNSLPAIEQILSQNPTIEVVIDLHRDAVAEGRKLAIDLQGRPTAQYMFFNGLSRTRNNGNISYLENPYTNDNLAFSFQMQVASNEYYPGIARRIYLKAYRYNMHLRAKSMLIELGAQTNTVEEIMNACDPLAHVIAIVLGAGQ